MKSALIALIFASGALLCAQDAPKTQAPPPPPAHVHGGMMGGHGSMMDMDAQAAKMRATLEKMKANLSKITDPALKQQAQYDVDLWEEMVGHMESMARMMKAHGGMGMGPGMGMPMGHPPVPPPDDKAPAPDKK
jgi:hypothetical protein